MKSPHFRSDPAQAQFLDAALPTFATVFGCLLFKSLLGLRQFLHCLTGWSHCLCPMETPDPKCSRGLGSSTGILLEFIPPSLSSAWPWHFHPSAFPPGSLRLQPWALPCFHKWAVLPAAAVVTLCSTPHESSPGEQAHKVILSKTQFIPLQMLFFSLGPCVIPNEP